MKTMNLVCQIGKLAVIAVLLVAGAAFAPSPAQAAVLEWDNNGTTAPNPQGGAGTWNTTALNWWTGSGNVAWNNSNNDDASFVTAAGGNKNVAVTGPITVNNLTVSVSAYTFTTGAGGQLTLNGQVNGTQGVAFNVPIVGGSVFHYTGTAGGGSAVTLNQTSSYTGLTTFAPVNQMFLDVKADGALGTAAAGTVISHPNASLRLVGAFNYLTPETITLPGGTGVIGAGVFRKNGGSGEFAGNIILAGTSERHFVTDNSTLTLSGVISDGGGNYNLGIYNPGDTHTRVVLTGNNTYGGRTTLNGLSTLQISSESNLGLTPGAPTANSLYLNGGTLRVTETMSLHANRGIQIGGSGTLSVDAGKTLTVNSGLSRVTGLEVFYKAGPGTLVVNGGIGSPILGDSHVLEGMLRYNATHNSAGNYTVHGGATFGGSGTINLAATKTFTFASGSAASPGNSVGTLTINNQTTDINGAFTYDFELGNAVSDLLATRTLNFDDLTAGTLVVSSLVPWQTYLWDYSDQIPVFTFSSSQSGFDPNDWTVANGGGMKVEGGYLFLQGNTIYLTGVSNVPEPSTLFLLACGGWLLVRARRR